MLHKGGGGKKKQRKGPGSGIKRRGTRVNNEKNSGHPRVVHDQTEKKPTPCTRKRKGFKGRKKTKVKKGKKNPKKTHVKPAIGIITKQKTSAKNNGGGREENSFGWQEGRDQSVLRLETGNCPLKTSREKKKTGGVGGGRSCKLGLVPPGQRTKIDKKQKTKKNGGGNGTKKCLRRERGRTSKWG